ARACRVDGRRRQLVGGRVADGSVERVITGKRVVAGYSTAGQDRIAVLSSTPDHAGEVFAWENGSLRQLSHQNDSLFAQLQLGTTEGVTSKSKDGTEVHS